MKRLIFSSLFFLIVIVGFSQENRYIRVNRNDGGFSQIQTSSVDSIVWSYFDWDEGLTDTWRSQIIYTKDRQYIIPLFSVESVLFNMPFVETEVIRSSVLPIDNVFDWDSFMLMSNDYYSVIKTDSDGITTIALDRVYSKNFSKAIIAQFSENMNPIYLLTDETTVFFFNYREDKVDVIIDYKGEIFHVENVIVDNAQQTRRIRKSLLGRIE